MVLDANTQRNLDLLQGARSGSVQGSLLVVLDRTITPIAARFPYTTLFRSRRRRRSPVGSATTRSVSTSASGAATPGPGGWRSEEHTSDLQSLRHLVCRLLLENNIAQQAIWCWMPIHSAISTFCKGHVVAQFREVCLSYWTGRLRP